MRPEKTMSDWVRAAVGARGKGAIGPCLEEDRLVDFYSGLLDEAANVAVREHLTGCARCRAVARQSRVFLLVMADPIEARPVARFVAPRLGARPSPLLLAAAMLIITAGAAILLWHTQRPGAPPQQQAQSQPPRATPPAQPPQNPWRDLVIPRAEYSPPTAGPDDLYWRNGRKGAQTQTSLPLAMMPYEKDDFHEAERQLALFLEAHPESADARFYRGVSLLMLGRTAEAAPPLMAAIEIGESRTREEARWYLALGFLKQDEPGKALEQLDVLATAPGHRRSEADKLRQEVRTRSPGRQ